MSNHDRIALHPLIIAIIVATGSIAINGALANSVDIELAFDLGAGTGARIVGYFVFGYAIGHFAVGGFAHQVNQKRLLLLSAIGFCFASVFCANASSIFDFAMGRVIQGFCLAPAPIIGRAVIRNMGHNKSSAKTMSSASAIFMWTPVLVPFLTEFLVHQWGWRSTYFFFATYGLIVAVVIIRIPKRLFRIESDQASSQPIMLVLRNILTSNTFVRAFIIGVTMFAGFFSLLAAGSDIVKLHPKSDIDTPTWIFLISGTYAIGAALSRMMLNYYPVENLLKGAVFLGAIISSSLLIITITTPSPNYVCLLLGYSTFSLCSGVCMPNAAILVMKDFPRNATLVLAILGGSKMAASGLMSYFLTMFSGGPLLTIALILIGASMFSLITVKRFT